MSKLLNYLGILSTILLGAHLLGLIENTGTTVLISWLTNPSLLVSSEFFTSIFNVITLIGVGASTAVIAGLILSQRYDLALMVPVVSLFLLIGWDILGVYNGIKVFAPDFAILLISPALFLYIITCIEWWREGA